MASSGYARYVTALRGAVYGLWSEKIYDTDFLDMVDVAIFHFLPMAYEEGAASLGIRPDEITDEERTKLTVLLFQQLTYTPGWAAFVQAHNKSSGTLLGALAYRTTLWANAYQKFFTLGQLNARADPKVGWTLGYSEHCKDCLKISGKIKRVSQFVAAGWVPQSSSLACGGYNCKCSLVPTSEPMSRGPLPKL